MNDSPHLAAENVALPVHTGGKVSEQKIDQLLSHINELASVSSDGPSDEPEGGVASCKSPDGPVVPDVPFFPPVPRTLREAGVTEALVEELVCKYLLAQGEASVRMISEQICLPFAMVDHVISRLKHEQVLGYIGQAHMNDYVCKLTEVGRERGRRYSDLCSYFGATPVTFQQYVDSIKAQTINDQNPTLQDLERAFSDLLIDPEMMRKLGPAVNSGKGMFLFGYPGNGKTSIAERVTASFGKHIWIPRTITVDRDIIRLFDPMNHVEAPLKSSDGLLCEHDVDARWVRIERPTIVVGGELTMDHLEFQYNQATGISEAPVQMKSNCGTLVIDDFGRQRMTVDELLNRWIVPLEKRYDYLNTSNGKKVQVPFDQLVIFSTNLEPKDLVDDAFLRRIPYKIEVPNPSRENFVKLFEIMSRVMKFDWQPEMVERLIEKHYLPVDRPFRNCQPRDLLLQVRHYCLFNELPHELTDESLDFACDNYFSVM